MVRETTAEIQRRKLPYVSMLQMDAEHLTFPDASFDAVLCGFAIFLFPHLEQALAEFFRVLRPGGKVGITVAQDLDALSHWYGERITDYHARSQFALYAGGNRSATRDGEERMNIIKESCHGSRTIWNGHLCLS